MSEGSKKRVAAVVVAAGRGRRLGEDQPKQYLPLGGKPLLRRCLESLLACSAIDELCVVINPEDRELYEAAVAGLELPPPVSGGRERQDSVRAGLESLEAAPPDLVLVHDAARPFVSAALIERLVAALEGPEPSMVCPALPVADTLKRAEDGLVEATVSRDNLWRVQTPQGGPYAELLAAHRAAAGKSYTDDAAVGEAAGLPVRLVPGDADNEKITTAADLARAEARLAALRETRVGGGFDVHRFAPGDSVTLCGLAIPHDKGLAGHSDADVALHALTDALLGALGEGDIGQHFPPSDPQWKGAPSRLFLENARDRITARGGRIVHVDVTVICEAPRIGPHREAMRVKVAGLLQLPVERVSVKATTTEKLGFTGRGEGVAAQATATLELPR